MSAFLKLNHEILSRRNLAVMQEVMQSGRASLLQKQEAELTLMRADKAKESEATQDLCAAVSILMDNHRWAMDSRERLGTELDNVKDSLVEVVGNYWALIDDCFDVSSETKENARGQKRKLPAAEQMKKIDKIVNEHNRKRARMFAAVMARARGAGSSTD